jgi:hypothetical protein
LALGHHRDPGGGGGADGDDEDDDDDSVYLPVKVPGTGALITAGAGGASDAVEIVHVAAGSDFSVFISSTGAVLSSGLNDMGQLGNGHLRNTSTPTQAMLPPGAHAEWR